MEYQINPNDLRKLILAAKNGDSEAFGTIYSTYFTSIFRYIYFKVKDKDTAEDLVQTVFLKVLKSLKNYEDRNHSPLAYLFTVARNTIFDHWKKKKEIYLDEETEKAVSKIPDNNNIQESFMKKEMAEAIKKAISKLPDTQQEVIILKYINDLSNKEIANLLRKNESTIRQLQCRALKSLHQHLKNSQSL